MLQLNRSNFQAHPFHLVSPSPWPLYTSISLLSLTTSAALSFHGFSVAEYNLMLGLMSVVLAMSFWWRDVIAEGKMYLNRKIRFNYNLNVARAIPVENLEKWLNDYKVNNNIKVFENNNNLGYYLAGLLEGDGHISFPSLGITTLNRVLNPRIVFTSHSNNLAMYSFIQSEVGNIGRFQTSGENNVRYIIGDIKGIMLLIKLMHGKLITPASLVFLLVFFDVISKKKLLKKTRKNT